MTHSHDHSRGLEGMLVVGLEHSVAGPLCTRILGDLGAEVIKLERPPAGDFSRHWDENAGGEGAQFWWLNRGKRGVAVDLHSPLGRQLLERLLMRADVLVQNMSPGAASRLGLDAEDLGDRYPQLVHCHISGYGSAGPLRDRRAYDMLVQAEAGLMSLTGTPEQPMRTGVSLCDVGTGIYASSLVLAALMERNATGRGRRVEVAMFDTALEFLAPMLMSYANAGVRYPRIPDRHPAIAPYGVFRCADGADVLIAIEQNHEWRLLCQHVLHDPSLAEDERFATNSARIAHRETVDRLVETAIANLTLPEATAVLDRLELAYGVVNDVASVAAHAVTAARGMLVDVGSGNGNGATVKSLVGIGERMVGRTAQRARPPRLGEDTDAVLREVGLSDPKGLVAW